MSLTTKALDRLLARVVDRIVLGFPYAHVSVHPVDIAATVDRHAMAAVERYLDSGTLDHRVNDAIDYTVAGAVHRLRDEGALVEAMDKAAKGVIGARHADVSDAIKDAAEELVSGYAEETNRAIGREVESLDVEDMAREALIQHVDFDEVAKEVAADLAAGSLCLDKLALDARDLAVDGIVAAVNAQLEKEG